MNTSPLMLFLAALAMPAAAAEPATATVTVSRADFASQRTRAKLDLRIREAIEQVCGSYASIESSQMSEMDQCWKTARAQAADKLATRTRASGLASRQTTAAAAR